METLKQSVMKIAGNTRTLTDTRIERQFELMAQLPQTQLVGSPQQRQKKHCAKNAKPRCIPPRGRDHNGQRYSLLVPYAVAVRPLHSEDISSRIEVGVG